MQNLQELDECTVLYPESKDLRGFYLSKTAPPFAEDMLAFVDALSRKLLDSGRSEFPDITALGFWCRLANVLRMQESWKQETQHFRARARGVVFILAPGNVDTLFFYTGLLSLLMGNKTVIRVSSRRSDQLDLLLAGITEIINQPQYKHIAKRLFIFTSTHESTWIQDISLHCDLRMIWGGDEAINRIRKTPLSASAKEVTFPDRTSLCLLNAEAVLKCSEPKKLAADFYRDLMSYAQQACSSPKAIVWHGTITTVESAKDVFWPLVQELNDSGPELTLADMLQRYCAMQSMAVVQSLTIVSDSCSLARVSVPVVMGESLAHHCGNGLILETQIEKLDQLQASLTPRTQTLTYFGYDRYALLAQIDFESLEALERIEKVGNALAFDTVWDGYHLLYELVRFTRK